MMNTFAFRNSKLPVVNTLYNAWRRFNYNDVSRQMINVSKSCHGLSWTVKPATLPRTNHLWALSGIIKGNSVTITDTSTNFKCSQVVKRHFSRGLSLQKPLGDTEVKKAIDLITDKFMEARELLSDARESEGTVYFSEDMEDAQEAVKETLNDYADLLTKLSDEQRQNVVRTIGLKMQELKAQLDAMIEELKEEH